MRILQWQDSKLTPAFFLSVFVLLVWLPSTLHCSVRRDGMASEIKL